MLLSGMGGCSTGDGRMELTDAGPTPPRPSQFDGESCEQTDPGKLFTRRIEPLLKDERPKSCNQCHLSGVDLRSFVRNDPCETMACLMDEGLVDLRSPEQSKILTWIERAEPDSDLITPDVIAEEYDGFLEWIEYSAACGSTVCPDASCGGAPDKTSCSNDTELQEVDLEELEAEDTGCSDLELETLFQQTVYQNRGRCYPCHYDYASGQLAGDPPAWVITRGSCNRASLETLREIQRLGLIDLDDPTRSSLLLKPLEEEVGGIPHGGDAKFHSLQDPGYRAFKLFIERYAACEQSR